MTAKTRVQSMLNWLRAGCPGGVPGPDRVPLLVSLRNSPLTEDQVKEVVREIIAESATRLPGIAIDEDEIARFIEGVAHHDGGPENVQRIADKLAAAKYTLEGLEAD